MVLAPSRVSGQPVCLLGQPRKLPAGVIHTPKFLPGAHLTNLSSSPDAHLGSNINVRCYHSQLLIDPSIQRTTELSVDKQCPVGSAAAVVSAGISPSPIVDGHWLLLLPSQPPVAYTNILYWHFHKTLPAGSYIANY